MTTNNDNMTSDDNNFIFFHMFTRGLKKHQQKVTLYEFFVSSDVIEILKHILSNTIICYLRKKNYAALPCPVTTNTSAAMQKQLVQIKKEKLEVDTKEEDYVNGARIRSEMAKEELSDERSAELLNETPPAPAVEDPTAPMPTLDEILKKYKFSTGSSTINK